MNVADAIARHAGARPYAVAVVARRTVLHYRSLDNAVWRVAALLRAAGIRPGDVVANVLPGGATFVVATLALARMGAIQTAWPAIETAERRQGHIARLGVRAVIAADAPAAGTGAGVLAIAPTEEWLDGSAAPADPGLRAAGADLPLKMLMSSGTTGTPSAVIRTHGQWLETFLRRPPHYRETAGDRFLSVVDPGYAYGFRPILRTLFAGGQVVFAPGLDDPANLARAVDTLAITCLALTPSHAVKLLAAGRRDGVRFPRLRMLYLSAAASSAPLRDAIRQYLSPALMISYATNESSFIALADAAILDRHPEAVGRPLDGIELQVVDLAGTPLPPGETGILRARAPWFPTAHVGSGAGGDATFRDGWLYPGDLGALSADGVLFVKGRADDLINCDGVLVAPGDIETVLLRHPAVAAAAVFAIDDPRLGSVPVAAVVLGETVSRKALLAFCRRALGARGPQAILPLPALPLTPAGKVDRSALLTLFRSAG